MIDLAVLALVQGLSQGLMLFLLSSGLSIVYGWMGILQFSHAAFYMWGGYIAYSLTPTMGWMGAWVAAVLSMTVLGAAIYRWLLRPLHHQGHMSELLLTFGLLFLSGELVRWLWGSATLSYTVPDFLVPGAGSHFTSWGISPARVLSMGVAVCVLLALAVWLRFSRWGVLFRALKSQPHMLESLGYPVQKILTSVFALGCGLAALSGVLTMLTLPLQPTMAMSMGALLFVVVVSGGLGSLWGTWWASLIIGQLYAWSALLPIAGLSSWAPALPFLWMAWRLNRSADTAIVHRR
ncbi:MAG: hypothetical protein RLZZ397_506 [Pseudomonadota bacterium]